MWLRLSADSIKEWCNNGYTDAWCLQYNQHLGKTLLVPLDEPKSMMEEILGETIRKIQTYTPKPTAQPQPPPGIGEYPKAPKYWEPGRVAQSIACVTHEPEVPGSIPGPTTYFCFSFH